ncbi:MAG TPA: ribosome maturation factor RimM [bacterium]|nr:ribosome maturation factor RimM [bacterium]HOL46942.1 ribosome maturation factor RimM [bacterium]HPQ18208.1 ribosome maturation factor RimM [bacterium]
MQKKKANNSEEEFICIGKIIKTYGNKGEVLLLPFIEELNIFKKLNYLFVLNNYKLKIVDTKFIRKGIILKFENFYNANQANMLVNELCYIEKKLLDKKLEKNEYYVNDIIGAEVFDKNDKYLGKIKNIIFTGANDVWEIINEDKEYLLPSINDTIEKVDLEKNKIIIKNYEDYFI